MVLSVTAQLGRDAPPGQEFRLCLLGGWYLTAHGTPVPLFTREQRLTAVLGLWRQRRPRPALAGTLWPTSTEEHALGSLRVAVRKIRVAAPGLLESTRSSVALTDQVVVDVQRVQGVLTLRPSELLAEPGLLDVLDYPELLPGWYDDWLLVFREQMDQRRLRMLVTTARLAFEAGDWSTTLTAASLACRIEPLHDRANELVVLSLLRSHDRVGALRALAAYRNLLRRELGVAPSAALERVVADEFAGAARRAVAGDVGA
ncbi:MAG: DNA-binding transcriptional activator of the family [Nocardioides sp.]|nr:DNA-binding transcriptional activator of the family [Nocardioides sp.]